MKKVIAFIEANQKRYLEELFELMRIPSVSADPSRDKEVRRAAAWCVDRLKKIGFEKVAIHETSGKPAVYGEWLHAGPSKPTILTYGHYDVQPEDPLNKWTTPPFEPTIRDGRIFGRGADDNKGQLMTQLAALEALMRETGGLPVNTKVLIEGEEESGGAGTYRFVEENRALLACDAVMISDSSWKDENNPAICYALRGMCGLEVKVKGPNRDLHSGVYGGEVANPINAMGKIIAKLHDEHGVIQVPGYYDDVLPLTDAERRDFREVGEDEEALRHDLGVPALWGEKGYTATERNWGRPSFDIQGIWGGYAGEGMKNVISSEAGFKIGTRLVANQDPDKCIAQIKSYIEKICPPGVTVEVKGVHGARPVMVPTDNAYMRAALVGFERVCGKRPYLVRMGASIPIVAVFLSALKAPSILAGQGYPNDNIHSPDESFPLIQVTRGAAVNAWIYEEMGAIKK